MSYLSATGFLLNGVSGLHPSDVLYVKFPDDEVILCSVIRVRGATARVKITRPASSQAILRLLETDHALYLRRGDI